MPSSRGSSQLRDQGRVSCLLHQQAHLYHWCHLGSSLPVTPPRKYEGHALPPPGPQGMGLSKAAIIQSPDKRFSIYKDAPGPPTGHVS